MPCFVSPTYIFLRREVRLSSFLYFALLQGGSNIIGTNCDLFTHKSSRSYLNHLVLSSWLIFKSCTVCACFVHPLLLCWPLYKIITVEVKKTLFSRPEVKKTWSDTWSPTYTFNVRCVTTHRKKFTHSILLQKMEKENLMSEISLF
jgi:hypothetical protein